MKKHTLLATLGVATALSSLAVLCSQAMAESYRPPVEQRQAVPASTNTYAGASRANDQRLGANQGAALEPGQPAVPANVQWQLYSQLQQLQREMASLRGKLEAQAYELEQIKSGQRQRYLDLDQRISELQRQPAKAAKVSTARTDNARPPAQKSIAKSSASSSASRAAQKKQYNQAIALMRQRKYTEAISRLEQLLKADSQGAYAANAQYWLGELHMANNPPDYGKAKKYFVALLTQHKQHHKAADTLYKLGQLYYKQGESAKAKVTLEKVIEEYPKRQAAKLAKQLLQKIS